ncbi:anaerobic ribonucleoside-triphosphate reductase activating protein [Butyrivibrio sp. AE3004]|uniref:anaerobic ribonucleoside-triphosphate reductase activating protein n=1 Tax=Butyrivibrio sp. AE3004 TaxID=1506994 RepID=UPI0004946FE2|nr:anaerobic ribonucleoside-triphosphate reductase activating protein [Butyrivibrio sp. AE3004]
MKIHGLQKMTLLDFPSKVAATVFLGGCDFKCPFCHNYEIVTGKLAPVMDDNELFSFLEKRKGLLDGVVVTGGEPCLNPGLHDLLQSIKNMGFLVKLDSNGFHPEVLQKLLSEKLLDYIAMDIKNSREKYALTCGLPSLDISVISKSIDIIMNSGVDYEFRTTVVHELHTDSDFDDIGSWILGAKAYYLQQFTPRDTVPDKHLTAPATDDLIRYKDIVRKYVPNTDLRGVDAYA